ncbi:MAG: hypothetical protein VX642_05225 [Bdellovibrionota bacterium]|nr:hypothetical protein [Bdellovibrionota bacterium]
MIRKLCTILFILSFSFCVNAQELKAFHAEWNEAILTEASSFLKNKLNTSYDSYTQSRNKILLLLKKLYPKTYSYWLKKLDANFKEVYFHELAKLITHSSHPWAQKISDQLLVKVKNRDTNSLLWMNKLLYQRHGRGAYEASTGNAYLSLRPFAENIVPVVHEMVHSLDPFLHQARNELDTYYQIDYNYYLFLKNIYLVYYKELLPRLISCEIFKDLAEKNIIESQDFNKEFKSNLISSNKNFCNQWTRQSLSKVIAPDYFWPKGSANHQKVLNYEKAWLKEQGLDYPYLIYRN